MRCLLNHSCVTSVRLVWLRSVFAAYLICLSSLPTVTRYRRFLLPGHSGLPYMSSAVQWISRNFCCRGSVVSLHRTNTLIINMTVCPHHGTQLSVRRETLVFPLGVSLYHCICFCADARYNSDRNEISHHLGSTGCVGQEGGLGSPTPEVSGQTGIAARQGKEGEGR